MNRVMKAAYRLARADTSTPIPYWMGRPIHLLLRWSSVIAEVQKEK